MEAKYERLLSALKDPSLKLILAEIVKDLEKKEDKRPVDAIGKPVWMFDK